MQRLAGALYARGLCYEARVQVLPRYDEAADELGLPREFIRAIGTSSGDLVSVNAGQLGWKPQRDQQRFLESMDGEIQAVMELDLAAANSRLETRMRVEYHRIRSQQ
ncbi:uncharacterized protein F4807DRAFT_463124 [Annulohypoxylon truncatum]|uniref:uncharacterized protein n=1 Tax=Annulohypoxylon truncatum TaxID=327061 RepID=UPI002007840D|nr:uncharacterized protein F4807DRAFT_463124 [Annulohypoxylon truncatum]KAI1207062.1 hypothetical protein F4807DRAFT_463124 [Annulohypoxylon truncatum]